MELEQGQKIFLEEAYERLGELEEALLELETNPEDKETVDKAFRAMHTIKGSGAMFGFDEIAVFTHEVESVYEQVRQGQLRISPELIALTLGAHDQVRSMLDAITQGSPDDSGPRIKLVESLQLLASRPAQATPTPAVANRPKAAAPTQATYRIRFEPHEDLFATGNRPDLILDELRDLGPCQVTAHTHNLPPWQELNPECCYLAWDVVLTTQAGQQAIADVFIFVEDHAKIQIQLVREHQESLEEQEPPPKLGEILLQRGDMTHEQLDQALAEQPRLGQIISQKGLVHQDKVKSALAEQERIKAQHQEKAIQAGSASIRVESEKLDQLVDLVGELVTAQARLNQITAKHEDPELFSVAEEVERLTTHLRDSTMSIRMLAIGSTFNKFRRLVRDLCKDLGVEAEMSTSGAETELDKTIIDRLNDPLVHIIRNAMDHGIEPPAQRQAQGKDPVGRIHLSALHAGAHVLISVSDDGAGLDPVKLKQKAIEKKLIPPDAELSEKEIFSLIFAPGFSTAAKVSNVSGRGVGMDVVRRSIESLRGSVEVNSKLHQGTKVTLRLPLTLAIIDGLMVELGPALYVLPLSSVEECIELTQEEMSANHGRNVTLVRGKMVPYLRLREELEIAGEQPPRQHVVIAELDGNRVGFVVDRVIGGHQTVIKNLGPAYRKIEKVSGATILGDGTVALILDINKLMQGAEKKDIDLSLDKQAEA